MSPEPEIGHLAQHFRKLRDPRIDRTKRYMLLDILVIAICAVICGADSGVEVAMFGKAKLAWLKTFLKLPGGILSHDTFGRVFAALDPDEFQTGFLAWVQTINELTRGQVIAIDSQQLRGSQDRYWGKNAISRVSAWATENQWCWGSARWTTNPTRSPPSPSCSSCWRWPAAS